MEAKGAERRRFKRCYFSNDENLKVILNIPNENPRIVAKVLDLSEGGMSVAFKKGNLIIIKGNDLIITGFDELPELNLLADIRCDIRWLINNDRIDYIGIGCEFKEVTEEMHSQIRNFINVRFLRETNKPEK